MEHDNENFEENNPPDITIPEFLPLILHHWPGLQPDDIKFHYHGTYNVFIIKNEYILRIPDRDLRNAQGLKLLVEEEQKLAFFHRMGLSDPTLQLPKPIYVHQDNQIPYMYYPKIPGHSLSTVIGTLSSTIKTRVAKQIAHFLDQLHSPALAHDYLKEFSPPSSLSSSSFSSQAYYDGWKVLYKKSQQLLYPLLPTEGQNWISALLESFLNHPELVNFQPTVVHGDFDTSNILVEGDLPSVCAVIDFEDTHIGDPAADMLFFREGQPFFEQILENRAIAYDGYIRNRMKFLYCRTCIPYLEWGVEHDRPAMVEYGKERLKRLMKKFPDPNVMKSHFF
ncbi:MAG: phosphotransferase family protein [Promethearchaeota archaeon]